MSSMKLALVLAAVCSVALSYMIPSQQQVYPESKFQNAWAKKVNKLLDKLDNQTYGLLIGNQPEELSLMYDENACLVIQGLNATFGRPAILDALRVYGANAAQIFGKPEPIYRSASPDLQYLMHQSKFFSPASNKECYFYQVFHLVNGTYQLIIDSFQL